jgi:hypothetical protein
MAENTSTYKAVIEIDTEPSIAELKKLKKQLKDTAAGSDDFKILQQKINDMEDAIKSARTGASNFTEVLGQLPGPIGNIGNSLSSTVNTLKQFGALKLTDIQASFTELGKDLADAAKGLGKLTGITKAYTTTARGLSTAFQAVGISATTATVAARAFSAALNALGIGLILAAVGALVEIIKDFASGEEEAKQAADALNRTLASQNELLDLNKASFDRANKVRISQMKAAGASEKEIRDFQLKSSYDAYTAAQAAEVEAVKTYNEKIKDADADGAKALTENLDKKQAATKDAYANYLSLGFDNRATENKETDAHNKELLTKQQQAADKSNAAKAKELEERKKIIDAAQKVEVENYLTTLTNRDREIYERGIKLSEDIDTLEAAKNVRIKEAREKGVKDITSIETEFGDKIKAAKEANRIDVQNIESKYDKEDLDKKEEQANKVKEFDNRINDIRISAILNEKERVKAERQSKYEQDLAAIEKELEALKQAEIAKAKLVGASEAEILSIVTKSDETKNKVRTDLATALQNDLTKIDDDAKLKQNEKDIKVIDDELRLLELRNAGLLAGTKAYFEGRAAILDEEEKKELAKIDITESEKTAIKEKYSKLRQQLDEDELAATGRVISATLDALSGLSSAIASGYDEEAKTSEEAFNKRKKLQKATALLSAASGLVQILTQPSTLPSPFDFIVKGINAAALAVSTAIQIKNIDKVKFDGGGSSPTLSSSAPAAPTVPTVSKLAAPTITGAQTPATPGSQIAGTLAQSSGNPIKAYVVSGDVTSQQALDRRTTRAATFSGGTIG